MKTLSWNVRGLGNPRTIRLVRQMLKSYIPQIVFLMETKLDTKHMERVRRKFGYGSGIEMGVDGSRGGLALFWKENIVDLRSFSTHHIDAAVFENDGRFR